MSLHLKAKWLSWKYFGIGIWWQNPRQSIMKRGWAIFLDLGLLSFELGYW